MFIYKQMSDASGKKDRMDIDALALVKKLG